eukprot:4411129-Alexandrium_andersonii.AAC.1
MGAATCLLRTALQQLGLRLASQAVSILIGAFVPAAWSEQDEGRARGVMEAQRAAWGPGMQDPGAFGPPHPPSALTWQQHPEPPG